jgi:hypothetical protein
MHVCVFLPTQAVRPCLGVSKDPTPAQRDLLGYNNFFCRKGSRWGGLPLPPILVLDGIDRHGLESAPSHREGEGVAGLQDLGEPPVPLQAELHVAPAFLNRGKASHQQWLAGTKIAHKLVRQA